MDKDNLWTRRSNTQKLSLNTDRQDSRDGQTAQKRFASSSKSNPFNTTPVGASSVASPTTGGSTAFGLGSGAFASFGSAAKTPKTPGSAFDFGSKTATTPVAATPQEKKESEKDGQRAAPKRSQSYLKAASSGLSEQPSETKATRAQSPLRHSWVVWYRQPTPKNSDYEKSTKAWYKMSTVEDFFNVYKHMNKPSQLPTVSDWHFFKDGIRPFWEDEENKKGGKWILRVKKGVADRYWEDLLFALIGEQFGEAGEEVCGAVVSARNGEDVFSIWTKNDGGRNVKIRETIKHVLALPSDTVILWKSHDDSMGQRTAIDQARQEKSQQQQYGEKRRNTHHEDKDSSNVN